MRGPGCNSCALASCDLFRPCATAVTQCKIWSFSWPQQNLRVRPQRMAHQMAREVQRSHWHARTTQLRRIHALVRSQRFREPLLRRQSKLAVRPAANFLWTALRGLQSAESIPLACWSW